MAKVNNKNAEKVHEGKMNITATYCVISPKDKNSSSKEGYCIEYMNMGSSNQGNFQLITLLLGLDEQFDQDKIKKVYEGLKYKYKSKLGLKSENMKYDDYKVKIYRKLDKKITPVDLKIVTDIGIETRIQLIGCILDIKKIDILKDLIVSFDLITPKDQNYKQYQEDLKKIRDMKQLWYGKDKIDLKKIKNKEVKGGSFRIFSSKNIYQIYMKRSRNNKRRTKHKGGSSIFSYLFGLGKTTAPPGQAPPGQAPPGQASTGQVPPEKELTGQAPPGQAPTGQAPTGQAPTGQAPPGQAPPGQAPPEKALTGQTDSPKTLGGSRRRRKLKRRKTYKRR